MRWFFDSYKMINKVFENYTLILNTSFIKYKKIVKRTQTQSTFKIYIQNYSYKNYYVYHV